MIHSTNLLITAKHCPPLVPPLKNAVCSSTEMTSGTKVTCKCQKGKLFSNGQNVAVLKCEERKVWNRHSGDCLGKMGYLLHKNN